MQLEDPIVITSRTRTPIGNFQGSLKDVSTTQLGANVIEAAVSQAHLQPTDITHVIMGCVLPAGLGQAPARQAALNAHLPNSVDCVTVNKVCGSGMKAVMLAYDAILAEPNAVFVAGGMESMTNAPYLLPKARSGYRLGHQTVIDHMLYDGLEDAYDQGQAMGVYAERCAQDYNFTREAQDDYALTSLARAQKAQATIFADEIIPVIATNTKGVTSSIDIDDGPTFAKPEKIPLLKSAFVKNGTITAANSSSISDGAAALTLMRASQAKKFNIQPIAKILGHATHSQAPDAYTTAPIYAITKLLKHINWQVADVDLWEINEAFAVVVMAAMKDLGLDHEKVNIHGGGCVLGHPIGATGARLIVTLVNALQHYKLKRGVAALCIGGGEATAVAIEIL